MPAAAEERGKLAVASLLGQIAWPRATAREAHPAFRPPRRQVLRERHVAKLRGVVERPKTLSVRRAGLRPPVPPNAPRPPRVCLTLSSPSESGRDWC